MGKEFRAFKKHGMMSHGPPACCSETSRSYYNKNANKLFLKYRMSGTRLLLPCPLILILIKFTDLGSLVGSVLTCHAQGCGFSPWWSRMPCNVKEVNIANMCRPP